MSGTAIFEKPKLVSSFHPAAFHEPFIIDYADHQSSVERGNARHRFLQAANFLGISRHEYFIFENWGNVALYLRKDVSSIKFSAAFNRNDPVSLDYLNGDETVSNRTLDRARRSIDMKIRNTPLQERIIAVFDREERSVIVDAQTGYDFIVFDKLFERKIRPRDVASYYAPKRYSFDNLT